MTPHDAIDCWRGLRLAVVGDAMVDVHALGSYRGLSPEEPGAYITRVTGWTMSPGGAALAAAIARQLGAQARLYGVVGVDHCGNWLRAAQKGQEVLVVDGGRPTTIKARLFQDHGQVQRLDYERTEPIRRRHGTRLRERLNQLGAEAVLLSDYGKGVLAYPLAWSEAARNAVGGGTVVLDPKDTLRGWAGVDAVTPNASEATRLLGCNAHQVAEKFLPGAAIATTLGPSGVKLLHSGHTQLLSCHPVEHPETTVGAGDAFAVGLTLARAVGCEWAEACQVGMAAALVLVKGKRMMPPNLACALSEVLACA